MSAEPMDSRDAVVDELGAEQARRWVVRLASGDIDAAQMAELQGWLALPGSRAAFDRQRALWRALGDAPARAITTSEVIPRRRWPALAAALAACMVLATLPMAWQTTRGDVRAGRAPLAMQLPDGSRMVLDAGAAADLAFDDKVRHVSLLRGRVWFDVRHGDARPFEVDSGAMRVRDVGTAFEVANHAQGGEVRVEQGAVDLLAGPGVGDVQRLRAGEHWGWHVGAPGTRGRTPVQDVAAWRRDELLFDAVPIDQVLRVLGNYRDGRLWLVGDFSGVPAVTATFRRDGTEEAIAGLVAQGGLRAYLLPGGGLLLRPPVEH